MCIKNIGIWGLRGESRKSWDHVISDKIIYFAESGPGDGEVSHVFSEKYLNGDCWFELHFTAGVVGQNREVHFNAICDMADVALPLNSGEPKIDGGGVHGNHFMLVDVPEFIQLPKGVIPNVSSASRASKCFLRPAGFHFHVYQPTRAVTSLVPSRVDIVDGKDDLSGAQRHACA